MDIEEKIDRLHSSWQEIKGLFNNVLDIEKMIKKQNDEIFNIKSAISRPLTNTQENIEAKNASYQKNFSNYLKKGSEEDLSKSDFGYQITRRMLSRIRENLESNSVMRKISSITEISGDSLELIEGKGNFAGWAKDANNILNPKDNKQMRASKISIPLHDLYGQIEVTQRLLDDVEIDIEAWIADELVKSFSKIENQAFINGNGDGQPQGILAKDSGVESSQGDKITADVLANLFFSLKEQYSKNAKFLMHRSTLKAMSSLRAEQKTWDYTLWKQALEAQNHMDAIFGGEIIECAEMPIYEKGNIVIAVGDFEAAYQIVDRVGIDMLRDPYTGKPNTRFYYILN